MYACYGQSPEVMRVRNGNLQSVYNKKTRIVIINNVTKSSLSRLVADVVQSCHSFYGCTELVIVSDDELVPRKGQLYLRLSKGHGDMADPSAFWYVGFSYIFPKALKNGQVMIKYIAYYFFSLSCF